MTDGLEFARTQHPSPATEEARREILEAPGFGRFFTDHMVSIMYTEGRGWHDAEVLPYGPIELDPAGMVAALRAGHLRGSEGLPSAGGGISSFRLTANAERLRQSARRLAMPELPDDLFVRSIDALLDVDEGGSPPPVARTRCTCGPSCFSTEAGLGVRPAKEYRYLLIASPAGAYFPRGVKPVSVWLSRSTCGRPRVVPAPRSSPATTPRRCWRRRRPRTRAATRWCGSTRSSASTSRRWAG